ncbi:hypothetical protein BBB_0394 [Bifidobacterium bifidum BGN4]|uniref:Uncharacterized protein n=1 Tax=Bifidobacterium bifidum BGN4 TaxID=484020 RepID=I3WGH6_BIFBI|nr:hypothetical protein BBB_0394 [Bifidobacterium bifidum BGN4]
MATICRIAGVSSLSTCPLYDMHLRKFQMLAQIIRRRNIHHMRDTPHAAAGRGNRRARGERPAQGRRRT